MVRPIKALPRTVIFNAVRSWLNVPQRGQEEENDVILMVSEPPEGENIINDKEVWTYSGKAAIRVSTEEWKKGNWQRNEDLIGEDWIRVSNEEWVVVAAYRHHRLKNPSDTAEWWADCVAKSVIHTDNGRRGLIIAGDLNAEHDLRMGNKADTKTWKKRSSPAHGEEIANVAVTAELYAIIDRKALWTRMGRDNPSAIDVVWSSHRIPGSLSKTWGTSDHCYTRVGGRENGNKSKQGRKPREKVYRPCVHTGRVCDAVRKEADQEEDKDMWKQMAELCAIHRQLRPLQTHMEQSWWNQELATLKKIANNAARRHAERPLCTKRKQQRTQTRRDLRRAIRQAKKQAEASEMERILKGERAEIEALHRYRRREERGAQAVMRNIAPTPSHPGESDAETAARLHSHNFSIRESEDPPTAQPHTTRDHKIEWKTVMRTVSTNAAAGPDGVTAKLLRKLMSCKEVEDILAAEMEEAWDRGSPGKGWRDVRIKYIPKPGRKDWSKEETWRPVGVMNATGKIYSAGVALELSRKIEWKAVVFGARKGVGCVDIMLRHANLIRHTAVPTNTRTVEKPTLIGVYFDVKSAYPATETWHIAEAFQRHPEIAGWSGDLLERTRTRAVTVEWEGMGGQDEIRLDTSGLDQGDPCSPIIWQLVMEGIVLDIHEELEGTKRTQTEVVSDSYADDGFAGVVGMLDRQGAHQALTNVAKACDNAQRR